MKQQQQILVTQLDAHLAQMQLQQQQQQQQQPPQQQVPAAATIGEERYLTYVLVYNSMIVTLCDLYAGTEHVNTYIELLIIC